MLWSMTDAFSQGDARLWDGANLIPSSSGTRKATFIPPSDSARYIMMEIGIGYHLHDEG
jgi:hypothetical protein